MRDRELADLPFEVALSQPELLAKGYCDFQRYRLTLTGKDGATHTQTRDILLAGKVVAVLPIDLVRDEIVLIRQFRLPAHLANGRGDMIEAVAGRVEAGESLLEAARRECTEEIAVAPTVLVELFSYLTTPGLTDEEVTVFLAAVDASRVPERSGAATEGEQIKTFRVSIDAALAGLSAGKMRNGPLSIALQWLALNRNRIGELLGAR
ncbi:MAG TPA: NUDIX hydrolase [Pseudolabrys sp.]|nr:NUDIX hydrolase [Pseudolabrys sp.]